MHKPETTTVQALDGITPSRDRSHLADRGEHRPTLTNDLQAKNQASPSPGSIAVGTDPSDQRTRGYSVERYGDA